MKQAHELPTHTLSEGGELAEGQASKCFSNGGVATTSTLELYSVAILLCTLNGSKYLRQQLDSISGQSFTNWRLYISDDGSEDDTLEIIRSWASEQSPDRVHILNGPQKGFAQNFLSLACNQTIKADYFAFCDQDDFWLVNKLAVAVGYAVLVEPNIPFLYCGRTTYSDYELKKIGDSPEFVHPPIFRNALVQCIAGGNTMLFNQEARKLLFVAGVVDVPSHDWWLYLLVTGAGGEVIFDQKAYVLYRQHEGNLVGGNQSMIARLERASMIISGKFKLLVNKNIEYLLKYEFILNVENRKIITLFLKMRSSNFKDRFRLFEVCGLYRQSWRGTLSLMIAMAFKRL